MAFLDLGQCLAFFRVYARLIEPVQYTRIQCCQSKSDWRTIPSGDYGEHVVHDDKLSVIERGDQRISRLANHYFFGSIIFRCQSCLREPVTKFDPQVVIPKNLVFADQASSQQWPELGVFSNLRREGFNVDGFSGLFRNALTYLVRLTAGSNDEEFVQSRVNLDQRRNLLQSWCQRDAHRVSAR